MLLFLHYCINSQSVECRKSVEESVESQNPLFIYYFYVLSTLLHFLEKYIDIYKEKKKGRLSGRYPALWRAAQMDGFMQRTKELWCIMWPWMV